LEEVAATLLEDAFSQIRAARMVVLVSSDSEDAEGDLVMAAEKVTPQHVNFMVIQGRGVVSVALPEKRLRELGIPLVASSMGGDLVEQAGALVEAREGVTTGISAGDRATTIGVLASDKSGP
jgi:3,4-dihydroxy 2-butanone 4-phosphate synthase/GTP cyclohydrolase II